MPKMKVKGAAKKRFKLTGSQNKREKASQAYLN